MQYAFQYALHELDDCAYADTKKLQDGRSSGLTAPNGPSQAALLKTVLRAASADCKAVDVVSVHGTGTPLGDPIEVGALGQGFGGAADREPLTILSNKSNFGHTEGAAGMQHNTFNGIRLESKF